MLSIDNQEKIVANSLEMEKQEEENGGSGGGQQPRSTCRKLMCADAPVCVCVRVGLSAAILKDPAKKTEGECGGMMLLCCLLHIWMPVYVIIYCWTHMPLLYIPCQCLPSPLLSTYLSLSLYIKYSKLL